MIKDDYHMAPGTLPGIIPKERPDGLIVCTYGGGVNSVALLVLLKRLGVRPDCIIMSDPGSEWPDTYKYRDEVMNPWLESVGFPTVTVHARKLMETVSEDRRETLEEQCRRTKTLPSAAYGFKKCSQKFKAEVVNNWLLSQDFIRAEFKAGRKVVKAIGYDADEDHRVRPEFQNAVENRRYVPWYPLFDRFYGRADCVELIVSEGLPAPGKSSCFFCPYNSDAEWAKLASDEPELFERALDMEARALKTLENTNTVGLRRRGAQGSRLLTQWMLTPQFALIKREAKNEDEDFDGLPCECAI